MEESQTERSKTPFCVPHRRKSHLKSQTYLTLVRIMSECHKHPQLCKTAPIDSQELRPDDRSNEPEEASAKQVHNDNEVVPPRSMVHDNSLAQSDMSVHENVEAIDFQHGGFSDTKTVIEEIENIMNTEEDEDSSKQKNLTVEDGTNEIGLQDEGFGQLRQLLMDELEDVMKGNEEAVKDNNSSLTTISLAEKQCGGGGDAVFSNNQEGYVGLQPVMPECTSAGQQQVFKEQTSQNTSGTADLSLVNTSETTDSSLAKSMNCEVSKLSDNNEDKISMSRTNEMGTDIESQQKEMASGKSVHTSRAEGFLNHMTEDGEMEEGEISGEFEVSDGLVMSNGESEVPQEQSKQLSEDVVDRNKFPFSDDQEENKKDLGSIPITVDMVDKATSRGEVHEKSGRNDMVCKRKIVVYEDSLLAEEPYKHKKQKTGYCEANESRNVSGAKETKNGNVDCGIISSNNSVSSIQNSDQTKNGDQGNTSKEKSQDAEVCNKKKRGPPSEQKKAKKKEKKRKKRAQKNRELGVKRLKLRPIQNPKPIAYCRHYIKGRCHEGEKCKFSHDTIPLTKSKPCCHFARHSCLKGDDCPFDHQLSKYPCTNYVSTGSCSRGEDCLFSHELPLKEDLQSTSNVCTPDLKPPSLPGDSNSKKQLDSGTTSHLITKASPNNVGLISHRSTVQNVAKNVLNAPVIAPKGISFLRAQKSCVMEAGHSTPSISSLTRNEEFKDGNKADQSTSGTTQTLNHTLPKGTPSAVAPKGINFLSFGKSPLGLASTKNLTNNRNINLPLLNNLSLHKQSTSDKGNSLRVGKEAIQSSTGTRCDTPDGLPSSSGKSVDRTVQASKVSPYVHQYSSGISQGPQGSPLSSSQSADFLAHGCIRNTPNSAQKALISTLAFTAKVESDMKMKQSTSGGLAVDSRATNKENGDRDSSVSSISRNDPIKMRQILDFLSSISGKTKQ